MKSIIFCLALIFACFFENQSFGMNQTNELRPEKSKNKNTSNSHKRYQCDDCGRSLSTQKFYKAHMMRLHAFCSWCKNYPIGKKERKWHKSVSKLDLEFFYNHLIECARQFNGTLYACNMCFGFFHTTQNLHFFKDCPGKIEEVLSDKKRMKQLAYNKNFKNYCGILRKDSSRVQFDHKSSEDKSKNIDFSNLVMASYYQNSLENFLEIIDNDSVEEQYDYLGDTDLTYNAILNTSVCGSFPSRISTQSCDVSSS